MTCQEIDRQLPAYLEDVLSPEEKRRMALHIASCRRCSQALADLERTGALLGGLPEVDPPPWLKKRIMAQVREEAKPAHGILRRLFFPLYIKVPIQALATVLIAVLAIQVYKTGEPEMKRMAPPPATQYEVGKEQAAPLPRKPLAVPPGRLPDRAPSVTPSAAKKAGAPVPLSPPGSPSGEAARVEDRAGREEGGADVAKPAAPAGTMAEKKDGPAGEGEALNRMDMARQKAFEKGAPIPSLTQKSREARAAKREVAPPASPLMSSVLPRGAPVAVSVRVRNLDSAAREIEGLLGQFNGRIVGRVNHEGRAVLTAEIRGASLGAFMERLGKIGTVRAEEGPADPSDGPVSIRIEIVGDRPGP